MTSFAVDLYAPIRPNRIHVRDSVDCPAAVSKCSLFGENRKFVFVRTHQDEYRNWHLDVICLRRIENVRGSHMRFVSTLRPDRCRTRDTFLDAGPSQMLEQEVASVARGERPGPDHGDESNSRNSHNPVRIFDPRMRNSSPLFSLFCSLVALMCD